MTYDLNITFDDNLITGNKTIDTQHKELIERIQNFVTACQNGDSKLKAIKMLDYLDEYTNFHFKEEEALQEEDATEEDGQPVINADGQETTEEEETSTDGEE